MCIYHSICFQEQGEEQKCEPHLKGVRNLMKVGKGRMGETKKAQNLVHGYFESIPLLPYQLLTSTRLTNMIVGSLDWYGTTFS